MLYSSATGASEPLHLAYMSRLLAPGFRDTFDMVQSLKKAGLGSLELFCMGLKATGCYLARTLSYKGAEFLMEKIKPDAEFRCAAGYQRRRLRSRMQPKAAVMTAVLRAQVCIYLPAATACGLCTPALISPHTSLPPQGDVRSRRRVLAAAVVGGGRAHALDGEARRDDA